MCELVRLLNEYQDKKTHEGLLALATIINDLDKDYLWEVLSEVTEGNDESLKMVFAEVILQSRPATIEEQALWFTLDKTIYPVYGTLSDNFGDDDQMTSLAKVIVSYYQTTTPDQQAEIITLLQASKEMNGFYFENDPQPADTEASVYTQIINIDPIDPPVVLDSTELSHFPD